MRDPRHIQVAMCYYKTHLKHRQPSSCISQDVC